MDTSTSADVLVIGCGISGLSCAVSAAQSGAKVIVLERATEPEFGGNTRWTDSYWRMKSPTEVSDDLEESLVSNAGHNIDPNIVESMGQAYENWPGYVKAHGMPDPELVSTLSGKAPETVAWLQSFGPKFENMPTYFMTAKASRIMPAGGGLALIEALRAAALKLGVAIRYETTATRLSRTQGGYELLANGADGEVVALRGRAVMIATGGYQGSQEMMTQYMGPCAKYLRPVARGGYYNKGEGIRLALALGAAPAGDFSSFHAEPVDPRSRRHEALVMNFPYGILVNRVGRRFTDEAPGPVDIHYDHIARGIKDQPDGIAWLVYDAKMDDVPNWKRSIRSDVPPLRAQSIDELARACGIPKGPLAATLREYNAACGTGNFLPLEVDGLATQGLEPPKSNWARPIDQAPYFAYPVIPSVCFTYGGVKTNSNAQVVDNDGRPIPGLYAAGEAAGLYYQVYTGATSVMRGAVFGRIAGAHAASLARN